MFTFHTDPGHGWLQVDLDDLKRLGLNPHDFSRYSYRKGNTFFLEEDCDASKFAESWEKANARKIEFRDAYSANTIHPQSAVDPQGVNRNSPLHATESVARNLKPPTP